MFSIGDQTIFVVGKNFVNVSSLTCQFGGLNGAKGIFISSEIMACQLPSVLQKATVDARVSLNNIDFSDATSNSIFLYEDGCRKGYYRGSSSLSCTPAPNGTMIPNKNSFNFTLCKPGTFSPKQTQTQCIVCPVAFFCPDFGLSKPVICTAGSVCDRTGLVEPSSLCPPGHFCLSGTKTVDPFSFLNNSRWKRNESTGVFTESRNVSLYRLIQREYPETGSKQIEHFSIRDALGEHPFPCPIGFYCREGVSGEISIASNFSTPQKCYPGYFCPRGSITPQGAGKFYVHWVNYYV